MISRRWAISLSGILLLTIGVTLFQNCAPANPNSNASNLAANSTTSGSTDLSTLYIGAYQEDRMTNPEDPTPGIVYLNIPAGGNFSGEMYFTYVGCQSSNIGWVSGSRAGASLTGQWQGTLDGTQQNGGFNGSWVASQSAFQGSYTVAGGKQRISVPSCIDYFVAPKGSFSLWSIGTSSSPQFSLRASVAGASWSSVAQAAGALIAVIDADAAVSNHGNAIISQQILTGASTSLTWSALQLVPGHNYVAAVLVLNSQAQVLARASTSFVR